MAGVRETGGKGRTQRYRDMAALRAAAQEAALEEWNTDPERLPWDRDGIQVKMVSPLTPSPDSLFYLSPGAKSDLGKSFTRESRRRGWERRAATLMRTLARWIDDVDKLLLQAREDEGLIGLGMMDLRTLWYGESSQPGDAPKARDYLARPTVASWRTTRLFPENRLRMEVVAQVFQMMAFQERIPSTRELALASILCGFFPESLGGIQGGYSVAEVIAAEVRAMRESQRRYLRARSARPIRA